MEDGSDRDDASLVLATQAGDKEAFALLFRRHHPTVRRVCARRLADGDADDVAQAAFVRAYERIDQCVGDRRFGAWVQVIALRMCGDAWRSGARTTPMADPAPVAATDGPDTCSEALLRKERAAAVWCALATLPPRQREVILARYVDGHRPRDVAAALTLSVGAVDSLLLRARRRLAAVYQVAGVEHGGASTAVAATSLAAGSAAIQLRPFLRPLARLGEALSGAVDALGAGMAGAAGLGPVAPTVAQRAAGLVGAGALILAPLAPVAVPPAADAPVAVGWVAAPQAGLLGLPGHLDLDGALPALALPLVPLPAAPVPAASVPPIAGLTLPDLPALPGTPAGLAGAAAPALSPTPPIPAAPLAETLTATATAPVAAVGQAVQAATAAVGEATTSTLDQLAATVAAPVGSLAPATSPVPPAVP